MQYQFFSKIYRLFLATKLHKGAQRKEDNRNHLNEKFLEVQKPFFKKVFGRRRQKDSDIERFNLVFVYFYLLILLAEIF